MKQNRITYFDTILNYMSSNYYKFFIGIFFLALFNLFYYLGETPIYSWDEARHGVSAYEMLKRNDYIINTFGYKNDYWNLKPPMSFWAIILGYKLVGYNPLGLRLYSAVAAVTTVTIISLFVKYKHGAIASLISALILVTTPQYIVIHCARTGDADSLFVLFFTASMISMVLIERNIKWLYLAGVFFSLAFMTKGWHAFNIALIGFLYLVFSKKIFELKIKEWALFFISSFSIIIFWGILRYSKDGFTFFKMMINYDLLARTSRPLEGHIGDHWYYINILKEKYLFWLILFGVCIVVYLTLYSRNLNSDNMDKVKKNYIIALGLWIVVPLIAFSIAKTKITWYIQPIYPGLAVVIGGLSNSLIRGIKRNEVLQLSIIILIIVGFTKSETIIKKHILMFKNDNARVTFSNFEGLRSLKGVRAYIISGSSESEQIHWRQSDMLTAELYGDIVPINGGLSGFIKDKDVESVLIIPKKEPYINIITEHNLAVISESNTIYILRKK